jgi:pantoate kinase
MLETVALETVAIETVFEHRFSDRGLAIAEHGRVVIMVWRGVPTAERIERATTALGAIAARLGGRVSLLAVIEERSPPPEVEHFHLAVRGFDEHRDALLATVGVLEDRTAMSVVLEAASIIRALQRRPTPTKFCADAREAATWLGSRHPHGGDPATFAVSLSEAVETTRARLDRP